MSIGTQRLCHVAILVNDINKALDNWSELLGMERPEIWNSPVHTECPTFSNGEPIDISDNQLAVFQLENVRIEIVQPGKDPKNPFRAKLDRDGEGLQHLAFICPDRKEAHETLAKCGCPKPYHIGYWDVHSYSFTDSVKQFGVEINIKTNDGDNSEKIAELLKNPDLHKEDL